MKLMTRCLLGILLGVPDRARFEALRVREEFYDTVKDPGCLVNLIKEPSMAEEIKTFRMELLKVMQKTKDQEIANYRDDLR